MKIDDVFKLNDRYVDLISIVKNDKYILCVLKDKDNGKLKIRIYTGNNLKQEIYNDISSRLICIEGISTEYNNESLPDFFKDFFTGKFDDKIKESIKK